MVTILILLFGEDLWVLADNFAEDWVWLGFTNCHQHFVGDEEEGFSMGYVL